jgi:hypothetical protein
MSSFPPCVRDTNNSRNSQSIRTVVAKIEAPNAAVMEWISSTISAGRDAQAVALVQLDRDEDSNVYYVVLTRTKADTLQHIDAALRKRLEASPLGASVTWIRAFDRRLQRFFDWGDVWAEKAELERLIEEDDTQGLTKCLPMLTATIAIGDVAHIPFVAGSSTKTPLLCLEDAPTGLEPNAQQGWMRLQHELKTSHVFNEASKNWQCSMCPRFGAARCACGAQRCHHHQTNSVAPRHRTVWNQSKFTPGPFYVQDPSHMRNDLKVEFLRDELDSDATLEEFAEVYVKLFADKICERARRQLCLDLYRLFNPAFVPKKECEIPPAQLHEFQKVFDSDAKPRCSWCSTTMEDQQQEYCSQACAEAANPPQKCQKCGSEDFKLLHCPRGTQGARVAALNGMSRCNGCGHTEFCEIVVGRHKPKRKNAAPVHWTKRRRS